MTFYKPYYINFADNVKMFLAISEGGVRAQARVPPPVTDMVTVTVMDMVTEAFLGFSGLFGLFGLFGFCSASGFPLLRDFAPLFPFSDYGCSSCLTWSTDSLRELCRDLVSWANQGGVTSSPVITTIDSYMHTTPSGLRCTPGILSSIPWHS